MAVEVKFTCNICKQIFIRTDGKARAPTGWAAVRPTLRYNAPYATIKHKPDTQAWSDQWDQIRKFEKKVEELKRKLFDREYHICHICLESAHDKILQIE